MESKILDELAVKYETRSFCWNHNRDKKTGRLIPTRKMTKVTTLLDEKLNNDTMFIIKYPFDSEDIDILGIDELKFMLVLFEKRFRDYREPTNLLAEDIWLVSKTYIEDKEPITEVLPGPTQLDERTLHQN